MENYLSTSFGSIFYKDEGKGIPLVVLHGYLETTEIFGSFKKYFLKNHRIISFDLPGHGKSEEFQGILSIKDYSEILYQLVYFLEINKFVLIGHSLGGYIALEFCSMYSKMMMGLVLLHSHPFADDEVKRRLRDKEIGLIHKGRKNSIVKFSIPQSFYDHFREKHFTKIEEVIQQASEISINTMMQVLLSMQNRKDKTAVLTKLHFRILIIQGRHDEIIDHKRLQDWSYSCGNVQIEYLLNSAHMGFIEEEDECVVLVSRYLTSLD